MEISIGNKIGTCIYLRDSPPITYLINGVAYQHIQALLLCTCGKEFTANPYNVYCGVVDSCGCREIKVFVDGKAIPEYHAWYNMIDRCENAKNKSYVNYGARGVSVCDRWKKGVNFFISDMGLRPTKYHSIERIDSNGNYCPENCKWATQFAQQNNKRNNRKIFYNGKDRSILELSIIKNITYKTLYGRLRNVSWSIEAFEAVYGNT